MRGQIYIFSARRLIRHSIFLHLPQAQTLPYFSRKHSSMKTIQKSIFSLLIAILPMVANGQITGKWKTIDDATGKPRSVVEIFERGGQYFGKVVSIFPRPGKDPDPVCNACDPSDKRYKVKVKGMEIVRNLKKDGSEYGGGDILDPENGKVYRCKIWLEDNTLKVRGYLGPFFRTQTWLPYKD